MEQNSPSEEINPANTMTTDINYSSKLWENAFLLLKPPSLWYQVMIDLETNIHLGKWKCRREKYKHKLKKKTWGDT